MHTGKLEKATANTLMKTENIQLTQHCVLFSGLVKSHQDCLHVCRHNVNLPLQWSGQWSRSRRGGLGWWLRPGWFAGSSCSCRHTQTDSTWGSALHGTARRTTLCKKGWDRGRGEDNRLWGRGIRTECRRKMKGGKDGKRQQIQKISFCLNLADNKWFIICTLIILPG